MRDAKHFDDGDFELIERLLEQDPPTRERTLEAVEPFERRSMLREMIGLAQAEGPIDRPAAELFPDLLRPEGFAQHGLRVFANLDEGGTTAIVYQAHDLISDQLVAVKVLTTPLALNPTAEKRFQLEMESLKRLDHPAIVPILRSGAVDGLPFFVMQFIDGQSLRQRWLGMVKSGDGVTAAWCWKVAQWVRTLALAIEHAHQRGICHRDIKPSNILLDEADKPYLADFGIAKVVGETTITPENQPPGTPAYMSPEQLGVVNAPVGPRSDVYSLGLVLYECLTLSRARQSATREDAARHCTARETPNLDPHGVSHEVPDALAAVCRRALSFGVGGRYATAGEMAEGLDRAIKGTLLAPPRPVVRILRQARRHRPILVALGVATLTTAAAIAAFERLKPQGVLSLAAGTPTPVSIRVIDPDTREPGPARRLGSAPMAVSLAPGVYRVELVQGGRLFEHTRVVENRQLAVVDFRVRRPDPLDGDMVLIPGGTAMVGHPDPGMPQLAQRMVSISPFWIDRCEVTNAEYRAFVLATGYAAPPIWPSRYDPSWDPLPVVGVTVEEARAYAEWTGKRLPTDIEWEIAAAGTSSQPFPWSATGGNVPQVLLSDDAENLSWAGEPLNLAARQAYIEHARPVHDAGVDVGPNGLLNAWGNVGEWTESMVMAGPVPCYLAKGRTWADGDPSKSFLQSFTLTPPGARSVGIGFRCARSANSTLN